MKPNKKVNNKYKKDYRGKRSNNMRNKSKCDSMTENSSVHVSDAINDVSYYISNDSNELTAQLNNYSFINFAGVTADQGRLNGSVMSNNVGNLMQIRLNPSAGFTSHDAPTSDGINVAGLRTYTYLSATNGRTTNYAPQDVTLLILAIGNVLANFSHGARALGLGYTYNMRNRAYPGQALRMCGFDYDDIKVNWAVYRTRYNFLVQKFNKIPILRRIKYFDKCSKIFSSVYLDEDGSGMAQSYALVPHTHWVFNEAYNPQGSGLTTTAYTGTSTDTSTGFAYVSTFSNFLADLENQIDALLSSSTLNYIYSDILRLYTKEGLELLKVQEIPDNYTVIPAKVDELSIWINNTVISGFPLSTPFNIGTHTFTNDNDVASDINNNCVLYRPQFNHSYDTTDFKWIMNFKHDNPTIEEKIYSTRLHSEFKLAQVSGQLGYYTDECALPDWYVTEICVQGESSATAGYYTNNFISAASSDDVDTTILKLRNISKLSKFDWTFMLYAINAKYSPTLTMLGMIGDLQYYTTITYVQVKSMHDVALLNLVSVI